MSEMISIRPYADWGGETEFLRRKNNKIINSEKRSRVIRVRGLHICLIFFVLIAAAFLAYKIGSAVLNWDKLKVKTFVLIDKPIFKSAEMEKILRRFNVNILTLSFAELREKLLTLPEIKDVSMSRKLPNTVEIRFILRKPVFQVAINGKFNIIDTEGVVLNTGNEPSNDLIGIQDVADAALSDLTPYLQELDKIKSSIDYVSYRKPFGIALKLKGKKELFYPGESDFARKIGYYLKLRPLPELKNYDIKIVDLRFKDRLYFEYETEVNN